RGGGGAPPRSRPTCRGCPPPPPTSRPASVGPAPTRRRAPDRMGSAHEGRGPLDGGRGRGGGRWRLAPGGRGRRRRRGGRGRRRGRAVDDLEAQVVVGDPHLRQVGGDAVDVHVVGAQHRVRL